MLLKLGLIRPSNSEWASPIVVVKKQNGDFRLCIDYRGLNKVTKRDLFLLPRINETLKNWFLNEIIKKYGCPKKVRIDRGTEFGSKFSNLLKDLDI